MYHPYQGYVRVARKKRSFVKPYKRENHLQLIAPRTRIALRAGASAEPLAFLALFLSYA